MLTTRLNNPECLYLAITFQSSLGAYPRRKHLIGTPTGVTLTLPSNSKTWQERVSKDKPSCLLGLIVSDKGKKKFYNIDTWRSGDICLDTVGVDSSGDHDLEIYFFEVKLAENLTYLGLCYWHVFWRSNRRYGGPCPAPLVRVRREEPCKTWGVSSPSGLPTLVSLARLLYSIHGWANQKFEPKLQSELK